MSYKFQGHPKWDALSCTPNGVPSTQPRKKRATPFKGLPSSPWKHGDPV